MPILVTCPTCGAKLNAPDAAAGKAVRCPKAGCGTVVPVAALVAAEEEPVEAKAVSPPPRPPAKAAPVEDDDDDRPRSRRRGDEDDEDDERPRKRSRRDEDDEDDRPRSRNRRRREDDDDDRPRRRPARPAYARGRRGGGGNGRGVVVVVSVLVGLAVLGGIGYGIYRLAGGGKAGPPAGWKEYTYAADNFKAYFPKEPDVSGFGAGGGGPFGEAGGNPFAKMGNIPGLNVPTSFNMYTSNAFDVNAEHRVIVVVVRYAGTLSQADRDRAMADFMKEQKGKGTTRSVTWLGETAEETSGSDGTARIVFVGDTMYMAAVGTSRGGRLSSSVESGFFDNFQLLK